MGVERMTMGTNVPESLFSWQMIASAPPEKVAMECRELPMPELKSGEALVKIAGCGVCGTDLGYFFDGIPTVSRPPITLGHEISGTVVVGELGLVGKKVIVPTILPCRKCDLCQSGRANRCLHQKMPGNSYGPYGGFASHIVVPSRELCVLPQLPEIGLEKLAVIADAVATPFQAAVRGGLKKGDRVIVLGATGGLGVYMAQWARLMGAECVIGIARNAGKLEQVREFGLDLTICSVDKTPWEVRKEFWSLCRKNGLDPRSGWKIFEMTGSCDGQEIALELLG
ncbi:MAG: alcohol dehydrogenase catalytic domain-containing protein, partial [Desulfuromonadales bacterium]